jgi:hypothetical protein
VQHVSLIIDLQPLHFKTLVSIKGLLLLELSGRFANIPGSLLDHSSLPRQSAFNEQ